MRHFDVVIVGAGAAGMMCAMEAGRRGRSVLLLEHNRKPGEKIRISGGGRCNFTNLGAGPDNFISANPKFVISALSLFPPQKFVDLLDERGIGWHRKTQDQLFCDGSARQIVDMLLEGMRGAGVTLWTGVEVKGLEGRTDKAGEVGGRFAVWLADETVSCTSVVIASGGKSIPKMGASGFGYRVAEQFGLRVLETRPGLVPLTFEPGFLARTAPLSGVSVEAVVSCGRMRFREALLFTHRGLSGPAILQISSFWRPGEVVEINLSPDVDVFEFLERAREKNGRQEVKTALGEILPRRLAGMLVGETGGRLADMGNKRLRAVADNIHCWRVKPSGTEGYRTAEVTLGGVDTRELNARTLEVRRVPGLYFIGEVVDVTGWLGGYNFQWAWASGFAAGQVV